MTEQLHLTHRESYLCGRRHGVADAGTDRDYRPRDGVTGTLDEQRAYGIGYEDGWLTETEATANWTANKRTLDAYRGQRKADANTRYVRYHSADDGARLHELADVTEPVAVVIRGDGSLDVYGYIGIVDQRGCAGYENRLHPRHTCPCGAVSADEPVKDDGGGRF